MRSILYILFALGGVLVVIALSMVLLDDEGDQQVQPQSPSIELSKPAADKAEALDSGKDSGTSLQPPNATPAAPLTIDLARVKPDGAAVLAGTAAPNAKIRIFVRDILIGETIANANGEWVIVLEKSLAARPCERASKIYVGIQQLHLILVYSMVYSVQWDLRTFHTYGVRQRHILLQCRPDS